MEKLIVGELDIERRQIHGRLLFLWQETNL